MMPALLTSTSIAPKRSVVSSTKRSTCSRLVTSQAMANTFAPERRSSSAARLSSSVSRAQITTLQPSAVNSRANSRPSPREPPVISTVLPASEAPARSRRRSAIPAAPVAAPTAIPAAAPIVKPPTASHFSRVAALRVAGSISGPATALTPVSKVFFATRRTMPLCLMLPSPVCFMLPSPAHSLEGRRLCPSASSAIMYLSVDAESVIEVSYVELARNDVSRLAGERFALAGPGEHDGHIVGLLLAADPVGDSCKNFLGNPLQRLPRVLAYELNQALLAEFAIFVFWFGDAVTVGNKDIVE